MVAALRPRLGRSAIAERFSFGQPAWAWTRWSRWPTAARCQRARDDTEEPSSLLYETSAYQASLCGGTSA
jgi:hypothetical protein